MPHVYVVDPKDKAIRSLRAHMHEAYSRCTLVFPMVLDHGPTGLPDDPACIVDATLMAMPGVSRFAWRPPGRTPICVHGPMVLTIHEIDQFHDYGPSKAIEEAIMESVTMLPEGVAGWRVYVELWEKLTGRNADAG